MRRFTEHFGAILAVVLATSSAVGPARANDAETAQNLYDEGITLRDGGDVAGAAKLFEAALQRVPSPIIGLDLARAYEKLGRLVDALRIVEMIAKMPRLPEETDRSAAARAAAAELGVTLPPRFSTLTLSLSGPDSDTATVLVDGAIVPASERTKPKKIDPGAHVIVVASWKEERREVTLAPGESRTVTIALEALPAAPTPVVKPVAETTRSIGTLGYVGFGIAGAGLVLGTVAGFIAVSKSQQLRDGCRSDGNCPASEADTLHAARGWGNISTAAFAIGAGGALLGIYAVLSRPAAAPTTTTTTSAVQPWIGVGSIGVSGAF